MAKAVESLPDRARLHLCLHNSILGKIKCLKDLEVHLAALKHDLKHIQVKFEQEEETPNDKPEAKENDSRREHICLYLSS